MARINHVALKVADLDLDAEMVDCRALANELGLFVFFAVVDRRPPGFCGEGRR